MNKFGIWLNGMMRGRYGADSFSRFLLIIALIVILIDMFLRLRILDILGVVLLIYVYCRMFSRNIPARSRENQKFLQFIGRFRGKGGGFGAGTSRDSSHKILRCPGCGEKLRVPKGAGKINISCPHCGTKFIKKL